MSVGLWTGDVAPGDCGTIFGTVLANVVIDALRLLSMGDFWRFISDWRVRTWEVWEKVWTCKIWKLSCDRDEDWSSQFSIDPCWFRLSSYRSWTFDWLHHLDFGQCRAYSSASAGSALSWQTWFSTWTHRLSHLRALESSHLLAEREEKFCI